jgi:signal transduction histidine kinase
MNPGRVAGWLVVAGAVALAVAVLPRGAAAGVAALVVVVAALTLGSPHDATTSQAPRPTPAAPVAPPRPEHEQITALLDLFSEGVLLLDSENTVIAANTAAAQVLGRPLATMTGVSLIRAARDHVFLDVLRESAAQPREIELGEQRVIFATATPVASDEIRTVLTLQDMTALRRAERARQDLIANVSHELRTPIAAALALAETLESGVDEPDQHARFSRQLTSEIERLGRIVDRLLRLSRLESRAEEFYLETVNIRELLSEAERRIAPVAERRSVEMRCEVDPGTPPARADRERVLEVLANLIDNAIRHSPERGTVRLRASGLEEGVRIDVSDEGPGIAPQDRLRIFERFYTGDRSRGDGMGTGLGLAIARHIVSRLGGEMWVSDEVPGATLSFTLPYPEPHDETGATDETVEVPTAAEGDRPTSERRR